MIQEAIQKLVGRKNLTFDESASVMGKIMEGDTTPAQLGAFLTSLRMKGETVGEVAGMASAMREKSLHVEVAGNLVDTCGTGGDGFGTFNISTAAAFVASGAGVSIAKHGNRAMSGKTGSADVLEALGAKIDLSPDSVAKCINKTGFGFMFAQGFHPSMRFAAVPRREIGIRTVFNILGPLTNPAGAKRQVIGVSDSSVGDLMAKVLGALGTEKALIVHGNDGLDEITLSTSSTVWTLESGAVKRSEIDPEQLGIEKCDLDNILVTDAKGSAEIIREVLAGAIGPARGVTILNSAAAVVAAGVSDDFESALDISIRSIDTGRALANLDSFVKFSRELD